MLYEVCDELEEFGVYGTQDVDDFAAIRYGSLKGKRKGKTDPRHAKAKARLAPIVEAWRARSTTKNLMASAGSADVSPAMRPIGPTAVGSRVIENRFSGPRHSDFFAGGHDGADTLKPGYFWWLVWFVSTNSALT